MGVAREYLEQFPALVITGARQSGKTTLARLLGGKRRYLSLENPDTRAFAETDPRSFLESIREGAILDEIQRTPHLLSYLQEVIDRDRRLMGRFILTGSSQLDMISKITQSLAGRVALLTLMPFSMGELQRESSAPETLTEALFRGFFPPLYATPARPEHWIPSYISTYIERDVRQVLNIQNLDSFQRFIRLCAGRTGQLLNMTSLADDCGINRNTVQSWLSVLEASHIIILLRPWYANMSKRLVKTPKLYFCDTALVSWLLGSTTRKHLETLPQRGALFENYVIIELLKGQLNQGKQPSIWFLRDKTGHEIDALLEVGPSKYRAIEIKSGATIASDFFRGLDYWKTELPYIIESCQIIYGGGESYTRSPYIITSWKDTHRPLPAR